MSFAAIGQAIAGLFGVGLTAGGIAAPVVGATAVAGATFGATKAIGAAVKATAPKPRSLAQLRAAGGEDETAASAALPGDEDRPKKLAAGASLSQLRPSRGFGTGVNTARSFLLGL